MGSDRVRAYRKSSSTITPGFKPEKSSFLQPRYQDQIEPETDSFTGDKQQNSTQQSNPTPSFLGHSFGRVSVLPIQTKLAIGPPHDKYEQEADRVAAQVVQQINSPQTQQSGSIQRDSLNPEEDEAIQSKPVIDILQRETIPEEEEEEIQAKPIAERIQRQEMPEEEEEEENKVLTKRLPNVLQRETLPEEEDEENIQTKSLGQRKAGGSGVASAGLEASIQEARRQGQPLSNKVRGPMEQAFWADFSVVRVHSNAQSDQLNKSIQSRAFTAGQDVFFRQGEYQPGSRSGQELLAHELTHVVQQTNGRKPLPHEGWHAGQQMQGRVKPTMQAKEVPINDDAGLEREADVMGAKASWEVGEDRQRSRREVVGIVPTNQPTVQRSVTGEGPLPGTVTQPTKWRVKMTGVAKMTGAGESQKKPIADKVIFDPGLAKKVTLSGILTFKQYQYNKRFRWSDPKWRRRAFDLPFKYSAYFTGTNKDGTAQVNFSSDTNRKQELKSPFGDIKLYEIEPSASGDTGLIKAKAFYHGHTIEVSTEIKLQPTKKEPEGEVIIGPVYAKREVLIDNFPRSKATVSPQNFKKIEDFWLSLNPETQKAIQDDKMLSDSKVQITGYTSNTDKVTNNFELGHKRAMAVRDILMKLSGNVVGTNLAPISKHERPIFTDDPKKEKEDAKQRKVKIELWELLSSE